RERGANARGRDAPVDGIARVGRERVRAVEDRAAVCKRVVEVRAVVIAAGAIEVEHGGPAHRGLVAAAATGHQQEERRPHCCEAYQRNARDGCSCCRWGVPTAWICTPPPSLARGTSAAHPPGMTDRMPRATAN